MENYASREATLSALEGLGFIQLPKEEGDHCIFLDSPKKDGFGLPIIQISIYQCHYRYWCVDTDGGFMAPCVWNGPRAEWDKSEPLEHLIAWLDKHHSGWR